MARQINFDDIREIQKREDRLLVEVNKLVAQADTLLRILQETKSQQDDLGGRIDKLLSWMPGLANSR